MMNLLLQGVTGQLFGGGVIPPGTIQIGTIGTTASGTLGVAPFSYAYDNSFSAWIIEGSELSSIGGGVDFTSLELYLGAMNTAPYSMINQRIYMAHIDKSNWTGSLPDVNITSSENLTNITYVKPTFSKSYQSSEINTWINFSFGSNFTWNGNDNIVIWWENRDDSFAFGGPRFDIENKSGSVAYKRQDNNYPTGSCFLDAERPIMKLNYQ